MLRAILTIVAVLIVGVAGLLLYASTQPDTFRVQRTMTIDAPADKIFAIVTDLRRGAEWSPYEKRDPNMKKGFNGPASGPGSQMTWDGNSDIGAGTLTIANVTAPSKVVLNLDMTKPMTAHNVIEYDLAPEGSGTKMTWNMHGPMNLISKTMCLFMNMDKMIGKDMEDGLRNLKGLAER